MCVCTVHVVAPFCSDAVDDGLVYGLLPIIISQRVGAFLYGRSHRRAMNVSIGNSCLSSIAAAVCVVYGNAHAEKLNII